MHLGFAFPIRGVHACAVELCARGMPGKITPLGIFIDYYGCTRNSKFLHAVHVVWGGLYFSVPVLGPGISNAAVAALRTSQPGP